MSTHFDLYCATCEKFGPEIRRSGSASLVVRTQDGFRSGEVAGDAWTDFLLEHEYHELKLLREGTRRHTR